MFVCARMRVRERKRERVCVCLGGKKGGRRNKYLFYFRDRMDVNVHAIMLVGVGDGNTKKYRPHDIHTL